MQTTSAEREIRTGLRPGGARTPWLALPRLAVKRQMTADRLCPQLVLPSANLYLQKGLKSNRPFIPARNPARPPLRHNRLIRALSLPRIHRLRYRLPRSMAQQARQSHHSRDNLISTPRVRVPWLHRRQRKMLHLQGACRPRVLLGSVRGHSHLHLCHKADWDHLLVHRHCESSAAVRVQAGILVAPPQLGDRAPLIPREVEILLFPLYRFLSPHLAINAASAQRSYTLHNVWKPRADLRKPMLTALRYRFPKRLLVLPSKKNKRWGSALQKKT